MSDYATHRFNIVSRITDMYSNWNGLVTECYDLRNDLQTDGNPASYIGCNNMAIDMGAVRNNWGGGSSTLGGRLLSMFDHLNDEMGGGDVDMASILTAMLAATPEEITQFMGITEAYKVAVWDAPYNEEFYAALARGFKTWGA